jgi:hypothetical protein
MNQSLARRQNDGLAAITETVEMFTKLAEVYGAHLDGARRVHEWLEDTGDGT